MPDILREAETDLAELAGLPGAIRDRVKAGLGDLRRLRDAVDAELARLTGDAEATLASLKALGGSPAVGAPPPDDGKPPLAF